MSRGSSASERLDSVASRLVIHGYTKSEATISSLARAGSKDYSRFERAFSSKYSSISLRVED